MSEITVTITNKPETQEERDARLDRVARALVGDLLGDLFGGISRRENG
jgi:hypothetical protein